MKKPTYLLLAGLLSIFSFLAGTMFVQSSAISLAAPPNAPIPTVNKKLNARYLENYRAREFVKRAGDTMSGNLQVNGVVDANALSGGHLQLGGDAAQGILGNGLVRAGVYGLCSYVTPAVAKSFDTVTGTQVTISSPSDGECELTFGFDVTQRYVMVTPAMENTIVSASANGNKVYLSMKDSVTGDSAWRYFYLIVY